MSLPPPPAPPKKGKTRGRKPAVPGLEPQDQTAVRLQQALFAGFVIYMDSPGMSVVGVWESGYVSADPGSPLIRDCISQARFTQSATASRWAQRREEHWRQVKARVENELMDQHVQRTMADIGEIQALKVVAMQHVRGDAAAGIKPVLPKSLEGVLMSYDKLIRTEHELRGIVVEQAANAAKAVAGASREDPQLMGAGAAAQLLTDDDGFTDEDIETMARAAALKNSLGGVPAKPDAAPKPPAIVKGDNDGVSRLVMEVW